MLTGSALIASSFARKWTYTPKDDAVIIAVLGGFR
jgi:hypothetical protein